LSAAFGPIFAAASACALAAAWSPVRNLASAHSMCAAGRDGVRCAASDNLPAAMAQVGAGQRVLAVDQPGLLSKQRPRFVAIGRRANAMSIASRLSGFLTRFVGIHFPD